MIARRSSTDGCRSSGRSSRNKNSNVAVVGGVGDNCILNMFNFDRINRNRSRGSSRRESSS